MSNAKTAKAKPKSKRRPTLDESVASTGKGNVPPAAMLARLHEAAQQLGLTCIDKEWRGSKARYHFRCAEGHDTLRLPGSVTIERSACPICRDNVRFARIQAAAQKHGGQCLETRYLGRTARYRFVCAEGHRWTSLPNNLLSAGHWCKRCGSKRQAQKLMHKDGLERLQKTAKSKGGVCLSTSYQGLEKRYLFRCAAGHEWEATGNVIMQNHWCWPCASAKHGSDRRAADGLERLQAAARAKGGECLSLVYTGIDSRYHMRCAQGHEWQAFGTGILNGRWCQKCSFKAQRDSIELMQTLAQARGGRCLSTLYAGANTKLAWECHRGHIWLTIPSLIKQGAWCPTCGRMNKVRKPRPPRS